MRPALVSGPPNRKKPYNKHLITLVFSVRTVNYGFSFFSHRFMARINRWKKHSVRNLQYGPKTRLIRGQCNPGSLINDLRKKKNEFKNEQMADTGFSFYHT